MGSCSGGRVGWKVLHVPKSVCTQYMKFVHLKIFLKNIEEHNGFIELFSNGYNTSSCRPKARDNA